MPEISSEQDITTRGPVQLPFDSEIVTDADEEVFLIYSKLQTSGTSGTVSGSGDFRGLGYVDSHKDTLAVKFDLTMPAQTTQLNTASTVKNPRSRSKKSRTLKATRKAECDKTVEIKLAQDTTALRSRKGDTGSILWKASVDFCQFILQQHHARLETSLLNWTLLETSHVLELGSASTCRLVSCSLTCVCGSVSAGTGLLSIAFSPLVSRYTVTDIDALLPLIRKNLSLNFDGWSAAESRVPGSNVYVEALDWQKLESTTPISRSRYFSFAPIDLILVVDCIYHPTLLPPLVETLDFLATPRQTAVLVVVELRAEDVIREFLDLWINKSWEIWRVGGSLLKMPYVMWLGWKRE